MRKRFEVIMRWLNIKIKKALKLWDIELENT